MRTDTKELCDLLDQAADLVEHSEFKEALKLLVVIEKLMSEWVERYLSP